MAEKDNTSALVAAQPGPLRDGLRAMLMMIPQVKTVNYAGDAPLAIKAITEHHPTLVLLDTSLPGNEIITVVQVVKANGTRSQCLVLADNVQQQRDAQCAGADVALVKGFPAAKLFDLIRELLPAKVESL